MHAKSTDRTSRHMVLSARGLEVIVMSTAFGMKLAIGVPCPFILALVWADAVLATDIPIRATRNRG